MKMLCMTIFALLVSVGIADVYMHMPKGANNRLNEKSANRQNGNRGYDTQNNNRGGYNVGDMDATDGFDANNGYATDASVFDYSWREWSANANGNDGQVQFEEPFLEASIMKVTWTAQHGCGNEKNNCNMVFEYTCDSHDQDDDNILQNNYNPSQATGVTQSAATSANLDYDTITGLRVQLKNGLNTNTPNDPNNIRDISQTKQNNDNNNNFRAESEEWYVFAKNRERNQGLFTADQNLQGNDQTKTRQNPGGTRRGLEVPEERDYFPWWQPTIWRPLFIYHNNLDECERHMASNSSAVETKYACVPTKTQINSGANTNAGKTNAELATMLKARTAQDCAAADGEWISQLFDMDRPACLQAEFSQVNNLGNVDGTSEGGLPQNVDWTMPTVEQMAKTGCYVYKAATGQEYVRFQTRIRYNMTTMDYSPYETTAECNNNKNNRVQSPVTQNPTVDVGVEMQGLRLALNTAQTGRTFQDRSHAMRLIRRPTAGTQSGSANANVNQNFAANALGTNAGNAQANAGTAEMTPKIYNLNVQGKRGNIVQTFPAVEYDFWPKTLNVNVGDCIAMQWTGSNTHNNGNPAGDGQAGDAGEGRGGSDRSNIMQILNKNSTYPLPLDKNVLPDFFENSKCYQTYTGNGMSSGSTTNDAEANLDAKDCQAYFMTAGFYPGMGDVGSIEGLDGNNADELDVLLNNTPASMRGITVCPETPGEYVFTCTRNNNFSNRDQKLVITVTQ